MKRLIPVAVMVLMAAAAAAAIRAEVKLPKCSMTMCRSVNCDPNTLCVSGAHVKTCADVCNNH